MEIEQLVPSAYLKEVLDQAEKDMREGNTDAFSPRFNNAEDAIKWLESDEA